MMYVVNYADGGFVIVGANRGYYPVLAYSDTNTFTYNQEIGGLVIWMEETQEAIRQSEAFDTETKAEINSMWRQYGSFVTMTPFSVTTKGSPEQDYAKGQRMHDLRDMGYEVFSLDECITNGLFKNMLAYQYFQSIAYQMGYPMEYTLIAFGTESNYSQVGPLLSTAWHQGLPYNYLCFGRAAGCATISLAQIMKFHEHPSSYNWSNIPYSGATIDTQTLIFHLGFALGITYLNNDTGAFDSDISFALTAFNYSYSLSNHNSNDVRNEILNNQRPISMGGYTNSILGVPCGSGHQWVCDGALENNVQEYYFVEFLTGSSGSYCYSSTNFSDVPSQTNPHINSNYSSLYFHMNWGWGGSHDNWFISNNVSSGNGNFQYGRTNFYIHP
jgi:hypothetical protein